MIREDEFNQESFVFSEITTCDLTKEQYEMIGGIITTNMYRRLKGKLYTHLDLLGLPERQHSALKGSVGKSVDETVSNILDELYKNVREK